MMVLIEFYLLEYWRAKLFWQLISASLVVSVGLKMYTSCPSVCFTAILQLLQFIFMVDEAIAEVFVCLFVF